MCPSGAWEPYLAVRLKQANNHQTSVINRLMSFNGFPRHVRKSLFVKFRKATSVKSETHDHNELNVVSTKLLFSVYITVQQKWLCSVVTRTGCQIP